MRNQRDECISMYLPARNAEPTLAACVGAIRAQSRPPDELFIVADPRSSDRTVEVARQTGLRVLEQRGPTLGAARNEAIAAAAHRWLACCDSDVVPEREWLARLADGRADGAVGIGGRTVERVRSPFDEWRALQMPHHWGEHRLRNPFMLVSEVLFDRRALVAVGGYRDDLNYYEDSDLSQRLRDAGYDLLYEPAAVATHQRTDTLLSLLALRWKYSEYRQRRLLDRYRGLVKKVRVNRDYALNTLSRSLARGHEELGYISCLLFFHHLVMDLSSLLSRRPMISGPVRSYYEHRLAGSIVSALGQHHAGLADWVRADLSGMSSPEKGGPPEQGPPPGWAAYLDDVRLAVEEFCFELGAPLLAVIETSARYVHHRIGPDGIRRLPVIGREAIASALEAMPIRPFVDHPFCRSIRERWPDATSIEVIGKAAQSEREAVGHPSPAADRRDCRAVTLAPHLEVRTDPLGIFKEIDANISRLVVCYQPPARFLPGLDVPSASDLASAAAAAGWTIEQFDTLVGRVRLMLSRTSSTPEGPAEDHCKPAQGRESGCAPCR